MAKYKFPFNTGNVCDGLTVIMVKDSVAEFEGEVSPQLVQTITTHGGVLVADEPPKVKAKKTKTKTKTKVGE